MKNYIKEIIYFLVFVTVVFVVTSFINFAISNSQNISQNFQKIASYDFQSLLKNDTDTVIKISWKQTKNMMLEAENFSWFQNQIRIIVLENLLNHGFSWFISKPYSHWNQKIILNSWFTNYIITENTPQEDSLDKLLNTKLNYHNKNFDKIRKYKLITLPKTIKISQNELNNLKSIFLFKDEDDLQKLGYVLVSSRIRKNFDEYYRRYNIQTSFENAWNVIVLNPNQEFAFLEEVNKNWENETDKNFFMNGFATIWTGIESVYWWWICGGATAIYQWILTNTGIEIVNRANHSIWYTNLYTATINWTWISMPGLDATVFTNVVDFKIKNIRSYPIILVMNYDWTLGWTEEVFTLSMEKDKWNFYFIKSFWGKWSKCFLRNVNWKEIQSCYGKIY